MTLITFAVLSLNFGFCRASVSQPRQTHRRLARETCRDHWHLYWHTHSHIHSEKNGSADHLPLWCDQQQRQGFPWPASYPEQGEIENSLERLESYLPPKTLSPLLQQQRADYWTVPFCCWRGLEFTQHGPFLGVRVSLAVHVCVSHKRGDYHNRHSHSGFICRNFTAEGKGNVHEVHEYGVCLSVI